MFVRGRDRGVDGHDVATTEDHPFWNATDSQWQRADALDAGDLLLSADGDLLEVDGLDRATARTTTAYNLTRTSIPESMSLAVAPAPTSHGEQRCLPQVKAEHV